MSELKQRQTTIVDSFSRENSVNIPLADQLVSVLLQSSSKSPKHNSDKALPTVIRMSIGSFVSLVVMFGILGIVSMVAVGMSQLGVVLF